MGGSPVHARAREPVNTELNQSKPNQEKSRLVEAEVGWSGDIGAKWRSRNMEWWREYCEHAGVGSWCPHPVHKDIEQAMKKTEIIINILLFLGFSAPPLLTEYMSAKSGDVSGTGFDILCYKPFDYAYLLLALAVFIAVNIQMARQQKKPISKAVILGVFITFVWFVTCLIAVGGMHLEHGGKL